MIQPRSGKKPLFLIWKKTFWFKPLSRCRAALSMPRHRLTTVPDVCGTECHSVGRETSILSKSRSIKKFLNGTGTILYGKPIIKNCRRVQKSTAMPWPEMGKNFCSQIGPKLHRSVALVELTSYINFWAALGRLWGRERGLPDFWLFSCGNLFFVASESAGAPSSWPRLESNLRRVPPCSLLGEICYGASGPVGNWVCS